MEEIRVAIQRCPGCEDIPLPRYMTHLSAGMDLHAAVPTPVVLGPGMRVKIPTGAAASLPAGYEAQIRPRSGLAMHHGVTLVNAPGTVDADYRGEIGVVLVNHGEASFTVRRGDRIAQMVVQRVCRVRWQPVDILERTQRGAGGFGHTAR